MSANPNAHRRVSECGLRLIKRWEGLYLSAYRDPVGVLTIGYGHTNLSGVAPRVTPGMRLDGEAHADRILRSVLSQVYEPAIRRNVKVALTQSQWDALVSWIYNLGEPNFKRSTMLKRINAGRFDLVPAEMMKWNKAGGRVFRGLTNRRADEAKMFAGSSPASCIPAETRTAPHVEEDTQTVHADHDTPKPEPLTKVDSWIERLSVGGGVSSIIAAIADWKVAAVIVAGVTVLGLVYLFYWNRREDT